MRRIENEVGVLFYFWYMNTSIPMRVGLINLNREKRKISNHNLIENIRHFDVIFDQQDQLVQLC